jgi:hypothetical protein
VWHSDDDAEDGNGSESSQFQMFRRRGDELCADACGSVPGTLFYSASSSFTLEDNLVFLVILKREATSSSSFVVIQVVAAKVNGKNATRQDIGDERNAGTSKPA